MGDTFPRLVETCRGIRECGLVVGIEDDRAPKAPTLSLPSWASIAGRYGRSRVGFRGHGGQRCEREAQKCGREVHGREEMFSAGNGDGRNSAESPQDTSLD